LNAFCAAALSPEAIAAYTFLTKVRIIERRLALCLRRFSDVTARFLADLILAKVQLPNMFDRDKSKAEDYAFWTFCCQWICANKRRLQVITCMTLGYVFDGARFYQLPLPEYSISQQNSLSGFARQ